MTDQPAGQNPFFDHPILNSPYAIPARHWELDESGQPTQKITNYRAFKLRDRIELSAGGRPNA